MESTLPSTAPPASFPLSFTFPLVLGSVRLLLLCLNVRPTLGTRVMIRGEKTFFIKPAETLMRIGKVEVLTAKEALMVQADEKFKDETNTMRMPGQMYPLVTPPHPSPSSPSLRCLLSPPRSLNWQLACVRSS